MNDGLKALLTTLQQNDVEFVLIGPLAARLQGANAQARSELPVDLVPASREDNLLRLAHALATDLGARLRLSLGTEPLPLIIDAGTFARLPVLPLVTRHGDLNIVLRPRGSLMSFQDVIDQSEVISFAGMDVPVATVSALLDGLAAGATRPDPVVVHELERLAEVRRIDLAASADTGRLSPERTERVEREIHAVLAKRAEGATIREIFMALGGRPDASYPELRKTAEALTERGRLIRERVGTGNSYRLNDDFESRTARAVADLLVRTSDPSATAARAIGLLNNDAESG
jgi:hypothetical protein